MKTSCMALGLIISVLLVCAAVAGPEKPSGMWNFASPAAQGAVVRYNQASKVANESYNAALRKARGKLAKDLHDAAKEALKKDQLNEAIKIKQAAAAVVAGQVPVKSKVTKLREQRVVDISSLLVTLDGHSYVVVMNHKITWQQAKEACEKAGGHLAYVDTFKKIHFLYSMTYGRNVYIGGERKNGKFRWLNGKPVEPILWGKERPRKDNKYDALVFGGLVNKLQDSLPATHHVFGFICEWEPKK